jgi:hypothetical protein
MNSNIIKPTLVILVALLLLPYLSQAQDHGISGVWYNGNTQTHINARFGNTVRLDNGEGSTATGFFTNPWTIRVLQWNVTGDIRQSGNKIVWSNGTTWTRFPDQKTHISGKWYHDGKPTSIDVYDDGWRFTITNEQGQQSDGKAQSARVLYIPSLSLTGYVNINATRIKWTNGTVWTRSPNSGNDGPLRK